MKQTIFLEVKNRKEDYIECSKTIERILNKKYKFDEADNIKIVNIKNKNMPFNKLEEPIDGKNMSSSFNEIKSSNYKDIIQDNGMNMNFHIRVHFSQDINIENLHYLALLISKYKNLIEDKKLSVFLVPRTSSVYPFEKNGEVDIELFNIASIHLRALIDNKNKGVIFGVYRKKESDENIVKALDFKKGLKVIDNFPIIAIDGNIIFDKGLEDEYISAPKVGNSEEREIKLSGENLNNYSLLFKSGLVNYYFNQAKQMKKQQRFGYAAYKKPNIALCDYVFETAYNLLFDKALQKEISIEEIESCLHSILANANIISFAIFSFIADFSNINIENNQTVLQSLNSIFVLSCKISSGIEQIMQNSIQHSSRKISILSFIKKNDNLKIIISDLSENSVVNTFKNNLVNENDFIEKNLEQTSLFSTLSVNKQYYKKTKTNITNYLNLNCFFNDFQKNAQDRGTLRSWFEFRQSDSSAHIGMSLFANTIRKCDGWFSMVSDNSYISEVDDNTRFFSTKPEEKLKEIKHFPGTEYDITLPMIAQSINYSANFAQFNSTNYIENYESFAKFIDYEVELFDYTIDRAFLNETYKKVKNLQIEKAIEKFSMQLLWTNYWLMIFENIKLGKNKIYSVDYSTVELKSDYVENNYARETIIKGFIDALGIFSSKHSLIEINIAFINVTKIFMDLFKEISLTLSLKKFPSNVQIFISDSNEEQQIQLLGNNYGLAIQNSYLLSLESYYESYDGSVYYDVDNMIKPFKDIIVAESVKVVPFLGILDSKFGSKSMFFSKVSQIADKDIINENGYKFTDNHTRLGNKVHIHSFYEMSHLFHRTIMANHVAFSIIRDLKLKSTIDILKDSVLFYGYASYSQAILMSLTQILEFYRILHEVCENGEMVSYSIYQYNLQYESNPGDIRIYLRNDSLLKGKSKVKIVQIVPISSTLTTFAKMWKKFSKEYNLQGRFELNENYTVFWVRDIEKGDNESTKNQKQVSDLEKKYFDIDERGIVNSKFSVLKDKNTINWILVGRVKWEKPETCEKCFPKKDFLKEIPIIETDPTSTVPSQQIYFKKSMKKDNNIVLKKLPFEDVEKYQKLYGKVHYGHFKRGKNHYQYFIDTQEYFASASPLVKDWLEMLSADEKNIRTPWPTIDIIFSPSHNTNVGFSQYVNAYYFKGAAEIISINEDKEFNSNFSCEYAMLKNTIQRLVDDFNLSYNFRDGQAVVKYNYRPVRFIFVDDNIITGDSFRKASKLLQSLLPEEIINNYGTNVFEKCFVLIDRMSLSSRNTYILPKGNFYAFCKINIPSMRKHGDSCVCCKLKNQAQRLYNRSSTQFSSNYWKSKIDKLEEKPFETIIATEHGEERRKKSYLYTIFSHLIKDFFKTDINNNKVIFNKILQLLNYFSSDPIEEFKDFYSVEYFSSYMPIISHPYSEKDVQFNKDSIKAIIKTISRPFFTYNDTIKQEILRYLIILSETILSDDPIFEEPNEVLNVAIEISKKVKEIFNNPQDLIVFVQDVVLDGLTDLHSTYLLRYKTMEKILNFINELYTDDLSIDVLKNFFLHYAICIQRLVDESNDETRSLRLEYFMITCKDDFAEKYVYSENERKPFFDNFLSNFKKSSLNKEVKEVFEIFCNEIFLGNGRILYDGIQKISADKSFLEEKKSSYYNYFRERWEVFRTLDNSWVNLCKKQNKGDIEGQDKIENQVKLFDLLHRVTPQNSNWNDSIVENRYRDILTCIGNMIAEKYRLDPDNMRLALLTCSKKNWNKPENISVKDFVIESCVKYEGGNPIDRKQDFDSNAKYIIKKRLLSALDDYKLNEFGYYIVNENLDLQICKGNEKVNPNATFLNVENTNHRKPYFILKFQNKIENEEQNNVSKPKTIVPVYLYLSFSIDDTSELERKILPQLIIRDILTYRKGIIDYLEEDFTTDVMERYAISIDQEAILKNEKVMSHTPMDQDKKELNYLLSDTSGEKGSQLYNEKLRNWIIVRSFCNTMIARLYNRVFRNINRTFEMILQEYKVMNREIYKLYVPSLSNGGNDGKNFPLNDINQVVPHEVGQNDGVYKLFEEIITFEVDDSVKSAKTYVYNFDGQDYAYNLDYVKNIIYRICFDALRFSYGAGAEKDNFIARILHHYENKKNEVIKKEKMNNKWFNTETHPICFVRFSVESSNSSNFDWLVIKNELYKSYENNIEYIKKKMEDPLDFTDGHMSLITAKEFFAKMLKNEDVKYLEKMYDYEIKDNKSYFVTKLPIITKEVILNEINSNNLDR